MDIFEPLRQRRATRYVIGAFAIALIGLLGWTRSSGDVRTSIESAVVESGPVTIVAEGRATLVPAETRQLALDVDAEVDAIVSQVGTSLSKDDVLVRLRSPSALRDLRAAEQDLAIALSDHRTLDNELNEQRLQRETDVLRARGQLNAASLERDAQRKLQRIGVASRIAAERAELEYETRREELALAEALRDRGADTTGGRLEASQSKVDLLRARRDDAAAAVASLELRSPRPGVVAKLHVQPGQRVAAGTVIAEVISHELDADIEVLDSDAAEIAVGAPAEVALGSIVSKGKVTALAPQARAGLVIVRVSLDQVPPGVRSQSTAEGRIHIRTLDGATYVRAPLDAQPNSAGTVWRVAAASDAQAVPVRYGPRAGERIVIASGLKAGDRILLQPPTS